MTRETRRTVLKLLGATTAFGGIGTAGARPGQQRNSTPPDNRNNDETLRLFSEVSVDGATEVVTQGKYAYVATGDGLAVVDWGNPTRPQKIVDMHVPGAGIWDVKVDGDLLAISSQGEHDHGGDSGHGDGEYDPDAVVGTHFYDVANPADPQYRSTFEVLPAGVHNHYLDGDIAYLCKEAPFDDSALKIVDVSDPTSPSLLAEWRVEETHPELDQPTNFVHDVYVQDGFAYLAYWDAGTRVLDVSDPSNPVEVSAFGAAPNADQAPDGNLTERLLTLPGNSHYVQPTPDGDYVLQGAETFPGSLVTNPDNDDYGGIKVFDVTDFTEPKLVTRIAPPTVDAFRTSHNFDITENRLYASWYNGGATVFDMTDPSSPEQLYRYDPDGSSYWTAVRARGFVVVSDNGAGITFLHEDSGQKGAPSIEGDPTPPRGPGPNGHSSG